MSADHSTEIFRPIDGFPGYRVSNWGRVQTCHVPGTRGVLDETNWRDKAARPIPCRPGDTPHLQVILYRNGEQHHFLIHRLVLTTFVGPCPEGMEEACHWDGNPQNNRADNLRWGTRADNAADRIRHGTQARGEKHGNSKWTEAVVVEARRLHREGVPQKDIAARLGMSRASVCLIVNRKLWDHVP